MKKCISMRINNLRPARVRVGRVWTEVIAYIPTKRFAKQAVKAAYGKRARIVER